jgi:hypothetical protein
LGSKIWQLDIASFHTIHELSVRLRDFANALSYTFKGFFFLQIHSGQADPLSYIDSEKLVESYLQALRVVLPLTTAKSSNKTTESIF